MKFRIFLLLLLFINNSKLLVSYSYAQKFTQVGNKSIFEDTIFKYESEPTDRVLFVPSDFAKHNVFQKTQLDSLINSTIIRIDLAFTLYKSSPSFDQKKLNEDRWNELFKGYPYLFENNATIYQNICQTGATTSAEARKYRHGFYIYYRKNGDSLERETELDTFERYLIQLENSYLKYENEVKGFELKKTELAKKTKDSLTAATTYKEDKRAKEKEKEKETKEKKKKIVTPRMKPRNNTVCRTAFWGLSQDSLEKISE
jgi:hypothetical protein